MSCPIEVLLCTNSKLHTYASRCYTSQSVLAIAKLTPGQEGYYERSVAPALDDYYAGRGESPGVWIGRGARALELEGVVQDGELGRLIRGLHPHTEKQLRAALRRTSTRGRTSGPTAGRGTRCGRSTSAWSPSCRC